MLSRRRFMNDRIASENGDNLVLQNVKGSKMNVLTVYGKSTQDGTPSPENPVPIVSAGDNGEINVSVSDGGTQSQTLTLSTSGGLPGIPVDSGGNYTDENGQQWVCDEIDLARGKYVQRIGVAKIEFVEVSRDPYWYDANKSYSYEITGFTLTFSRNLYTAKDPCNRFIMKNFDDFYNHGIETGGLAGENYAVFNISKTLGICTTLEEFKVWFDENVVLYKILATPIETDLPAEEIAAYKALHTYSPTTTVSNDAGAWMKVGYRERRR